VCPVLSTPGNTFTKSGTTWSVRIGGGVCVKFIHNEEDCYEPTNWSAVSGMEQKLARRT
jgi:hypothetical protein